MLHRIKKKITFTGKLMLNNDKWKTNNLKTGYYL